MDIGQIGPQQGGNDHGPEDEQTAHCWNALFAEMGLWPVLSDDLTDVQPFEPPDKGRPNQQAENQRGDGGADGPKGNVAEEIEQGILSM